MKEDLDKFKERYPTYIEALDKIDELNQRIAELEEIIKDSLNQRDKLIKISVRRGEENAKLQERLKNAIVPKFKIGQVVWTVDNSGKIINGKVIVIEIDEKKHLSYTIHLREFCVLYKLEEHMFKTKAKAQKYLEEHNG